MKVVNRVSGIAAFFFVFLSVSGVPEAFFCRVRRADEDDQRKFLQVVCFGA